MRFLFAILLLAIGGVFWFLIPGFGLSDNPSGKATNASPAESRADPPTKGRVAAPALDPAEAAVESAIRAVAEPRDATTASTAPLNIATDIKTVIAQIKAAITPESFDANRANEIINMAMIADIQKATLRRLVETTQANPDLLRSALSRAETAIQ